MEIKVKKIHPDAMMPIRGSDEAAGFDLYSNEGGFLLPFDRKSISTGISLQIPKGYFGRICPRSGLAYRYGIDTLAGVIDSDYRGDVKVILINTGDSLFTFEAYERIAQIVFIKHETFDLVLGETNFTDRGDGKFGSTGLN